MALEWENGFNQYATDRTPQSVFCVIVIVWFNIVGFSSMGICRYRWITWKRIFAALYGSRYSKNWTFKLSFIRASRNADVPEIILLLNTNGIKLFINKVNTMAISMGFSTFVHRNFLFTIIYLFWKRNNIFEGQTEPVNNTGP